VIKLCDIKSHGITVSVNYCVDHPYIRFKQCLSLDETEKHIHDKKIMQFSLPYSVYLYLPTGMDFNDTPFVVTMAAGTTVVTAGIPIVDDEINEAEEVFVVVLEVVSDTTNRMEFTTNTTVCRIPANDRPCVISWTMSRSGNYKGRAFHYSSPASLTSDFH